MSDSKASYFGDNEDWHWHRENGLGRVINVSGTMTGLGASRAQARQFVAHGLMTVNGKKVDIPSYITNIGDVISVKETRKDMEHFKIVKEGINRVVPKWITTDPETLTAKIEALPEREDIDLTLQENMIVEFYSR